MHRARDSGALPPDRLKVGEAMEGSDETGGRLAGFVDVPFAGDELGKASVVIPANFGCGVFLWDEQVPDVALAGSC